MWPSMQEVNRKRRREAATQRVLSSKLSRRMSTIGQEQPVTANESGCSTFELRGQRLEGAWPARRMMDQTVGGPSGFPMAIRSGKGLGLTRPGKS